MVSYLYTDGSCRGNGKNNPCAGIGVYFGEGDSRNVSKRIEGKQTNNVAELSAIIEAFTIIENDLLCGKEYVVVTDSEYVIKCVNSYGRRCAQNGWLKNIPNKQLVRRAYHMYEPFSNVSFMHVTAHTNEDTAHARGNAAADRLANRGATSSPLLSGPVRVDLKVPYARKEEAKELGARWDPSAKTWYTTEENKMLIERFI